METIIMALAFVLIWIAGVSFGLLIAMLILPRKTKRTFKTDKIY